jgi:hypothetical protein
VKVCPLSSNEVVEPLPNKIPGYATAAAQTMLNTSHKMMLKAKISEAAWTVRDTRQLNINPYVTVNQYHYRPGQVQMVPGT